MADSIFTKELLKRLKQNVGTSRGIPEPQQTVEAIYNTVEALKETVETLLRVRNEQGNSAVLVRDMEPIFESLLTLVGSSGTGGSTPGSPSTPPATGNPVVSVVVNAEGELIVVFADGTVVNAGSVGRDFIAVYGNTLSPVALPKETWVTIANNGEGDTSVAFLPPTVDRLMNTDTGALDFSGLTEGDGVVLRPDYLVTPTVDKALLKFRYLLGSGSYTYVLERTLGRLDAGSGSEYIQGVHPDYVPMLDSNTLLAPVVMQVWLSEIGELVNNSVTIQVIKR